MTLVELLEARAIKQYTKTTFTGKEMTYCLVESPWEECEYAIVLKNDMRYLHKGISKGVATHVWKQLTGQTVFV